MALHDSLGDRMKEYERRNQYFLQRRIPVCIRVDMRAGHTFTKGFVRPFDEVFSNAMIRTMEYCAKNIENCVFSYCQSDEITFILIDYKKLETEAWFDYRTDKLCSIAASMATMAFNKYFIKEIETHQMEWRFGMTPQSVEIQERHKNYVDTLYKATEKGAMFDARVFNIPKEEVTNLVYWRQLDAARNSVQMVGQANFSHSQLQGKSCNDIQDMLMIQKGINWNDFPTYLKRGAACIQVETQDERIDIKDGAYPRKKWSIDLDMPMLKGDDRKYLDELIYIGE